MKILRRLFELEVRLLDTGQWEIAASDDNDYKTLVDKHDMSQLFSKYGSVDIAFCQVVKRMLPRMDGVTLVFESHVFAADGSTTMGEVVVQVDHTFPRFLYARDFK